LIGVSRIDVGYHRPARNAFTAENAKTAKKNRESRQKTTENGSIARFQLMAHPPISIERRAIVFAVLAILFEAAWNAFARGRGAPHDFAATVLFAIAGFFGGLSGSAAAGVLLGFSTAAVDSIASLLLWLHANPGSQQGQPAPWVVVGAITLWGGLVGWVAGVAASITPWSHSRRGQP
jgi:hypothetical protein